MSVHVSLSFRVIKADSRGHSPPPLFKGGYSNASQFDIVGLFYIAFKPSVLFGQDGHITILQWVSFSSKHSVDED